MNKWLIKVHNIFLETVDDEGRYSPYLERDYLVQLELTQLENSIHLSSAARLLRGLEVITTGSKCWSQRI